MVADRKLTGWHVLAIFVGAFTVIIGVNLALAFNAVKTFPGLEVKNSYVASQNFDERRDAQLSLGWDVRAEATGGLVILHITDEAGKPVHVVDLHAVLGRATHVKDDLEPEFRFDGKVYTAMVEVGPGNWNVRMRAKALDGTPFEQRVVLHVE